MNTINWNQNGTSIIIKNIEDFTKILPNFFKTKNYSSFVRQLNMYGFSKVKNKNGFHEFEHKHFLRGNLSSLSKIKRKLNDSQETKGENSNEYKNLLLEFNRIKKVNLDFEESLKVLAKQNKKMMDANRQLVYQFYYFKKESDLKTKKVVFLFYSMLINAYPEIKDLFQRHFSNIINFSSDHTNQLPQRDNAISKKNYLVNNENFSSAFVNDLDTGSKQTQENPRALYQDLESKTEYGNELNGKNIISKMVQQMFNSENGNHHQNIDHIIKDYLDLIENRVREVKIADSHNSGFYRMRMNQNNQTNFTKSIKNPQNYFSEDLDLSKNSSQKEGFNELIKGALNQEVKNLFKYTKKTNGNNIERYGLNENNSSNKSYTNNYEKIMASIQDKFTNYEFKPRNN